jgi:hypothetical protein
MKKVYSDKIVNIKNTDLFDNRFLFDSIFAYKNENVQVVYMSDLLEKYKNIEILEKVKEKPAMFSNVYSPTDELNIFKNLFENALHTKKKIHIV